MLNQAIVWNVYLDMSNLKIGTTTDYNRLSANIKPPIRVLTVKREAHPNKISSEEIIWLLGK